MVLTPVMPGQRLTALRSIVGGIGPIRQVAKVRTVALEFTADRGMASPQATADFA
jgi:hypothetical protein